MASNATTPVSSSSATAIGPVSTLTKSRFPRMQECAHFHYEVNTVDIPNNFQVGMLGNEATDTPAAEQGSNAANFKPSTHDVDSNSIWFQLLVTSHEKKWIIYRTYENFCYLDKFLHECIFDRKFSCLDELKQLGDGSSGSNHNKEAIDSLMTSSVTSISSNVSFLPSNSTLKRNRNKVDQNPELTKHLWKILTAYLNRFCEIAFINPINCGPILNWFEVSLGFFLLLIFLFTKLKAFCYVLLLKIGKKMF
jgi:hypothetical protein